MDDYMNRFGRLICTILSLIGSLVIFAIVLLGFEPSPKLVALLAAGAASIGGVAPLLIKRG